MLRKLLDRLNDWTGDSSLDRAIHRELRVLRLSVHSAKTRRVKLVAIERPGWVQVRRFEVETLDENREAVMLFGVARDDGRRSRIEVLLTADAAQMNRRLDEWSEGLIRRD